MIGALWAYDGWNNIAPLAGRNPRPAAQLAARLHRRHVGGRAAVFVGERRLLLRADSARDRGHSDDSSVATEVLKRFLGPACCLSDRRGDDDLLFWVIARECALQFAHTVCHGAGGTVLSSAIEALAAIQRAGQGADGAGGLGQCTRRVWDVRYAHGFGHLRVVAVLRSGHGLVVRVQAHDARYPAPLSGARLSRDPGRCSCLRRRRFLSIPSSQRRGRPCRALLLVLGLPFYWFWSRERARRQTESFSRFPEVVRGRCAACAEGRLTNAGSNCGGEFSSRTNGISFGPAHAAHVFRLFPQRQQPSAACRYCSSRTAPLTGPLRRLALRRSPRRTVYGAPDRAVVFPSPPPAPTPAARLGVGASLQGVPQLPDFIPAAEYPPLSLFLTSRENMSISTILLIVLVLLLIGALPTWPYSSGWGYYPSGGLGLVLIVLLVTGCRGVG